MKIEQFTNASKFAFKIDILNQLLAVGSIAIGAATIVPTAPAQAATLGPGAVSLNGFTQDFVTPTNPITFTTGNTFSVDFSNSRNPSTVADGALAPYFPGSDIRVAPSGLGVFEFVDGSSSNYRLTNDLTFAFASGINYNLNGGSIFQGSSNNVNSLTFNLFQDGGSSFTSSNGFFDPTPAVTDNFNFSDISSSTGGSYTILASTRPVPEPFTIIGTIIGGTAAFRLRKKLSAAHKK